MQRLAQRAQTLSRLHLNRPASYAEKILFGHLEEHSHQYVKLRPDRVAMQDASAQTAVLQFASTGLQKTAVPASIHCDHYVQAQQGHARDLELALRENLQVFEFLQSAAGAFGMDFWRPGAGIIHQTVLENVSCWVCVCNVALIIEL
jgi:aconitase A